MDSAIIKHVTILRSIKVKSKKEKKKLDPARDVMPGDILVLQERPLIEATVLTIGGCAFTARMKQGKLTHKAVGLTFGLKGKQYQIVKSGKEFLCMYMGIVVTP